MKLFVVGLMAIALVGCGGKTQSPEFEALEAIESGLKVNAPVEEYRDNIIAAHQAIGQIEDPNRQLLYNAAITYHMLALDLWQCPDRACEIEQMTTIKSVTKVPIVDPATDDPNLVLDMLWRESEKVVDGLEEQGMD